MYTLGLGKIPRAPPLSEVLVVLYGYLSICKLWDLEPIDDFTEKLP